MMLLKEYADYLETTKISDRTIKTYCGRLRKILNNGYSEDDLVGAVDIFISRYCKGGCDYNEKDSGNTAAALRKLKDYIQAPYSEDFFVAYKKGYSSFVPLEGYVSEYTISDGVIRIVYKKNYIIKKIVTKKIPKTHYRKLIDIFLEYQKCLSKSDTAIITEHGPESAYRYVFDGRYGSNCAELFEGDGANHALDEYRTWIEQFIHNEE